MKQSWSIESGAPSGREVSGPAAACRAGAGFTMIELMIVVAIIAILAAIAYPSYVTHITKTHRTAAKACLSQYANYMERYYTTNLRYDQDTASPPNANKLALAGLDCASAQQTGANYSYGLPSSSLSASIFTVTADPQGAQKARDTKCGMLSLDQKGARTVSGTGSVGECW